MIYRFFIFLTVIISLNSQAGEIVHFPSCHKQLLKDKRKPLDSRVAGAFQRSLFFNPKTTSKKIYTENECYINVVRLFRELTAEIPDLKAKHFKVLYFGTPAFFEFGVHSTFATQPIRRSHRNSTTTSAATYHVVLEINGNILDLSNDMSQTPVLKSQFFESFFAPPKKVEGREINIGPEEIQLIVIPGEDYLLQPEEQIESAKFHQDLYKKYRRLNAKNYLYSKSNPH